MPSGSSCATEEIIEAEKSRPLGPVLITRPRLSVTHHSGQSTGCYFDIRSVSRWHRFDANLPRSTLSKMKCFSRDASSTSITHNRRREQAEVAIKGTGECDICHSAATAQILGSECLILSRPPVCVPERMQLPVKETAERRESSPLGRRQDFFKLQIS